MIVPAQMSKLDAVDNAIAESTGTKSCIVLKQDSALIGVLETSVSSGLVAGIVPGVEPQPLKKHAIDERALRNASQPVA